MTLVVFIRMTTVPSCMRMILSHPDMGDRDLTFQLSTYGT
jgi:hypothetical protein